MTAIIQTFCGSNNIHNRGGFSCINKWAGAVDGVSFSLPKDEIVCHFVDRDSEIKFTYRNYLYNFLFV